MATPGDTAMPMKRRSARSACGRGSGSARAVRASRLCWGGGASILFIEAGLDQGCQSVQRFLGIPAFSPQLYFGANAGAEHHQAHNRSGGDSLAVAQYVDGSPEAFSHGDKTGCGTSMQTALVADGQDARENRLARRRRLSRIA